MAGDSIEVKGAWATIQAASSTADTAMSAGARTTIVAALDATSEKYPILDFKCKLSATSTPALNGVIELYRRSKADTDESPAPTTTFKHEFVGVFITSNVVDSSYYLYDKRNVDENATYYMLNGAGATLTIALSVRGASSNVN